MMVPWIRLVYQGYGNGEKWINLTYILQEKLKGLAYGLSDEVEEMEDTRMIYRVLAWDTGRIAGGTSYRNKENREGVGGCERQWSEEGPRVPLWTH